jgi:adenylate cyclase
VHNTSPDPQNALAQGLQVGEWRVDPRSNELSRGDESMRLEPKAIEVLVHLARRAGQVVGREELLSLVWPGVVVGDDALTQAIIKLRKALGDDARQPTYIETISKRGYRLLAPVTIGEKAAPAASAPPARAPDRRRRLWPALVGAALVVAAMAIVVVKQWSMPAPANGGDKAGVTAASLPIIAVLPLANQSGDPKRDYFSDGVTEDIINALGLFSGLRVMSSHAVAPFKARAPSADAIRSELAARYLVKGSVREADGRLRVTVELSDAATGIVLWSDRYEGEGRDVFEIHDRIVKNIVGTLAVKVTRLEEGRAASKPPDSFEAYDLMLRARSLLVRSDRIANRQARALLAKALELAPNYAEAHVLMAAAESQRSLSYGWTEDPAGGMQRAQEHAQRALATDDPGAQARAHGQLGIVYAAQGQWEKALAEADLAIELNPSDDFAFDTRGSTLMWLGRADEAIGSIETALRFNPAGRGAATGFNRALTYYMLRRYGEAVAAADAALARYPDTAFLHAIRAAALAQQGNQDEARRSAAQVIRFDPFFRTADFGSRFVDPQHMAQLQDGLRKAGL